MAPELAGWEGLAGHPDPALVFWDLQGWLAGSLAGWEGLAGHNPNGYKNPKPAPVTNLADWEVLAGHSPNGCKSPEPAPIFGGLQAWLAGKLEAGRAWLALVLTAIRPQALDLNLLTVCRLGWLASLAGWEGLAGHSANSYKSSNPAPMLRGLQSWLAVHQKVPNNWTLCFVFRAV